MSRSSTHRVESGATSTPATTRRALRAIALFEASKGLAALAAVVGIVDVMHHDIRRLAVELIGHVGLQPTAHVSSLLLHYAAALPTLDLRTIIGLGIAYALLRLCEAYGLWQQRYWGKLLGAVSGGLYIPLEVMHLVRHPHVIALAVLTFNVSLIGYLFRQLQQQRCAK